jgi:3-deoxy-manno-octulosonate cytidylyltransferase (CMP-KDO synthetase)
MKILCVIPSRIGSTRLARKPLADIAGKPMIQRTYEKAIQCPVIDKVIVATDSEEIADVVRKIGGEVEMTDSELPTGSDRVAAVASRYPEAKIVINLQGDEPFIKPHMLTTLVSPYLQGETPPMTTIACPLIYDTEYDSPDIVKVLINNRGEAMYFSRSPIPYFREKRELLPPMPVWHHQGLYAYRHDFLDIFTRLPQTPLELAEKLEQLRALEHGYTIRVSTVNEQSLEINTPEELERAQEWARTHDV